MTDTLALMRSALRGDVEALSHVGVIVRPPWWRRRIQAHLAHSYYRRWVQRVALAQMDEKLRR